MITQIKLTLDIFSFHIDNVKLKPEGASRQYTFYSDCKAKGVPTLVVAGFVDESGCLLDLGVLLGDLAGNRTVQLAGRLHTLQGTTLVCGETHKSVEKHTCQNISTFVDTKMN